jgi:hypothetical protein
MGSLDRRSQVRPEEQVHLWFTINAHNHHKRLELPSSVGCECCQTTQKPSLAPTLESRVLLC